MPASLYRYSRNRIGIQAQPAWNDSRIAFETEHSAGFLISLLRVWKNQKVKLRQSSDGEHSSGQTESLPVEVGHDIYGKCFHQLTGHSLLQRIRGTTDKQCWG